jgi:hypothetical protein
MLNRRLSQGIEKQIIDHPKREFSSLTVFLLDKLVGGFVVGHAHVGTFPQ